MAEMIRVGQEFYEETLELKKARKLEGGAGLRRQVKKRARGAASGQGALVEHPEGG